MAAPEAGNTRYLLIFLDQRIGLPVDIRERDLNLNFSFRGAFFGFSGTHNCLSKAAAAAESEGKFSAARYAATLSVKTLEEQRQTAEGAALPTKVTGECFVRRGFLWRGHSCPRKELQLMQPPATRWSRPGKATTTAKATAAGEGARSTRANAALWHSVASM
jgi:hypothetical protein